MRRVEDDRESSSDDDLIIPRIQLKEIVHKQEAKIKIPINKKSVDTATPLSK